MKALVTLGIPTYGRPELLGRALASVAKQDYADLEVLVADNATPGQATAQVVESYRGSIPRLSYVKHETNIGPLGNFMILLGAARGRYFMWLADDDEISANFVSSLVGLLETDDRAASAAGHWLLMRSENDGRVMPTSSYRQATPLARALHFIWHSDDAFFYALHRTDVLRQANFTGYSWPNRGVLHNWAYVYLLDVVLRGRVLIAQDTSVQFINHDYTAKTYPASRRSFAGAVARALRRMNVHYLYWRKCARLLNPLAMPLIVATSVASLAREGAEVVIRSVQKRARVARPTGGRLS